ncbi:hypothetical protein KM043_004695 [Ampulex compressa]|nr:hypothetical protein KM043_004695 [Ampulex compressa]
MRKALGGKALKTYVEKREEKCAGGGGSGQWRGQLAGARKRHEPRRSSVEPAISTERDVIALLEGSARKRDHVPPLRCPFGPRARAAFATRTFCRTKRRRAI